MLLPQGAGRTSSPLVGFSNLLNPAHTSVNSLFLKIFSVKTLKCFIWYHVTPSKFRILGRVLDCPSLDHLPTSQYPRTGKKNLCSHFCVKRVLLLTKTHSHGDFSQQEGRYNNQSLKKKTKQLSTLLWDWQVALLAERRVCGRRKLGCERRWGPY